MPVAEPAVAIPFAALHTPPPAVLVKVMVLPTHTLLPPLIVPADGSGFTVPVVVLMPVAMQLLPSVTVRVYTPLAEVAAEGTDGFCSVELNELGPAHE